MSKELKRDQVRFSTKAWQAMTTAEREDNYDEQMHWLRENFPSCRISGWPE